MNCREFSEIADSYLSDELLVETNHELFHHLENCAKCREELGKRRELRIKLREVVKNSAVINPIFANKLRIAIKEVQPENSLSSRFLPWLAFAGILIVLLGSFFTFRVFRGNLMTDEVAGNQSKLYWQQLSTDALADHKHCGLEKGKGTKKEISEDTYQILKTEFSNKIEFIQKHDCVINNRRFTHLIFREKGKVISVLTTESELIFETKTIMSEPSEDFQIAGFNREKKVMFVVSDLPEAENLHIARILSSKLNA